MPLQAFPLKDPDIWFDYNVVYEWLGDLFSPGVVGTNDLQVQPQSPAALGVQVTTGRAYVQYGAGDIRCVKNTATSISGASNPDWSNNFTAAAANPRIDRVVVQVTDESKADPPGSGKKGIFRVLTGTATAGADLSNLSGAATVPSFATLLANVLVNGATIPSGNIDIGVKARPALRGVVTGGYLGEIINNTNGAWTQASPGLFTNIPQIYKTLVIDSYFRFYEVSGTTYMQMHLNGDTNSANYDSRLIFGPTTVLAGSSNGAAVGAGPWSQGTPSPAALYAFSRIVIPDYSITRPGHALVYASGVRTGASDVITEMFQMTAACVWRSTSPITWLGFSTNVGGFATGTRFQMWGQ